MVAFFSATLRRPVIQASIVSVLMALSACPPGNGSLHFLDLRVIQRPGTAAVLYGRLENNTGGDLTLESITSRDFGSVQIHSYKEHDGQAHMQTLKNPVIRSGDTLVMKPGGIHIMLNEPSRPLKTGDIVHITLRLNQTAYDLEVPVREDQE